MRSVVASRVLRRFALSQLLLEVQFWFPVWLIFLTDRGFSITTAVLADGVFRLTVVALELPLGVLADRVGRRRAYLGTTVLTAVAFLAITGVREVPQLMVAWVAWGVLWALSSGTGSSYLYELVAEHAPEVRPTSAFGAIRAVTSTAVLASHLTAGWLYRVDPTAPFLVTVVLGLAAGAVAWGLPEIGGSRRPNASLRTTVGDLRSAWTGNALRLAVTASALLLVVGWSVRILFQPLILDLELSPTAAGLSYFGYSAMAVAAGLWCGTVGVARRHLVVTAGFALLTGAVIGTAVAPGLGPFLFVPLMGLGYHVSWTLLDVLVNEHTPGPIRATVASGISLVGGLAIAAARPILGALADSASVATAFGVWAVVAVAGTAVAVPLVHKLASLRPVRRK